jgi:spermidine/putrescine transport system permease protein
VKRSKLPYFTVAFVLVFFYLPVGMLVLNSFNASRFGGSWEGFTLDWYRKLGSQREIWAALRNSLVIGVAATAISTVLGTCAAFALDRRTSRLQHVHSMLVSTPLVVPEILMGMGLLLFFVTIGLSLGLVTVLVSHVTFCLSYVAFVVLGRLQDFDWSLVDAARDLGASSRRAFLEVTLPLLAPGILAGALLAFTLSIDDFVITFFTSGPGSTTLPVRIYSMIKHGSPALINALSTILLVVTFTAVWLSQRLGGETR